MRIRLSGEMWGECEEWMEKDGEMGDSACVWRKRGVCVYVQMCIYGRGLVVDEVYW